MKNFLGGTYEKKYALEYTNQDFRVSLENEQSGVRDWSDFGGSTTVGVAYQPNIGTAVGW